jgi:hypothetical protein
MWRYDTNDPATLIDAFELAMNIVRYMMFFVFGMLLGLLLSALLPSLALWLRGLNS